MKKCLPSEKSKDSWRVSASVQSRPPLTVPLRLSFPVPFSWPTGFTLKTITCNNVQLRGFTSKYAQKNQVCKLFLLTDGVVTRDMSAMS